MYQLPGEYSAPAVPPRISVRPRLGIFLLVWVLLGCGFIAFRAIQSRRSHSIPPPLSPPVERMGPRQLPDPQDLARHLEEAAATAAQAQAQIRAAEASLGRLSGVTTGSDRQLQLCVGRLEHAAQQLTATRAELDFLHNTLKGEDR